MITVFTPMLLESASPILPPDAPMSRRTILLGIVLCLYPAGARKPADPSGVGGFPYAPPFWLVLGLLAPRTMGPLLPSRETHPPERRQRLPSPAPFTSLPGVAPDRRIRMLYLVNALLYLA